MFFKLSAVVFSMRRLALDLYKFAPILYGSVLPGWHSYFSRGVEFRLLRRQPDARRFLEGLRNHLQTKGYSVVREPQQRSDTVRLRRTDEDHFRISLKRAGFRFIISMPTENTTRLHVLGMPISPTRALRGKELHITDKLLEMMSRGARKRRVKK